MSTSLARAVLALSLPICALSHAGNANTGRDYSNFGTDLSMPIFPHEHTLALYQNKTDGQPSAVFKEVAVIDLGRGADKQCIRDDSQDGWVHCTLRGKQGWVKRAAFASARQVLPVEHWPFRQWIYVASDGMGGAETDMLYKYVPRSPYLIKPVQFDNVFFIVRFDNKGRAISPKTGRHTGDRVYGHEVGKAT